MLGTTAVDKYHNRTRVKLDTATVAYTFKHKNVEIYLNVDMETSATKNAEYNTHFLDRIFVPVYLFSELMVVLNVQYYNFRAVQACSKYSYFALTIVYDYFTCLVIFSLL
jgi:L-ascorbate metabolism protein UlaG (beta-lactamase superfamily)